MKKCLNCDKPARESRRLCRTCETNKYMERRYDEYKALFGTAATVELRFMGKFMEYLDQSYGDQKREIASRVQYVYKSLSSGDIQLTDDRWELRDIEELDRYRENLPVQHKTAIFHLIQYIKTIANLQGEEDELKISKVLSDVPECFQAECRNYLEFLRSSKNLKHWTRYQLAYSLKYFFTYIDETYQLTNIKEIGQEHFIGYLKLLKKQTSQKNLYTRSKEVDKFFKWAKQAKMVFVNPTFGVNVQHYAEMTQPLTLDEQRTLVKRWLDPSCDPREALIGLLALLYACSAEELASIKRTDLQGTSIRLEGRANNIQLEVKSQEVVKRYLEWRSELSKDAECDYLIITRESYVAVDAKSLTRFLKPCNTTVNQLRITQLIEIASTGNIKALEMLGLSYEGTRRYLQFAVPTLFIDF